MYVLMSELGVSDLHVFMPLNVHKITPMRARAQTHTQFWAFRRGVMVLMYSGEINYDYVVSSVLTGCLIHWALQ